MASFTIAAIKNQIDEVRAQVYPRNETEKKVYEAVSSKNWGASTTLMNDIASDTNDYEKFNIVMKIIWESIEGDGKTWKHVFKGLTLLEFLIKNGSERCVEAGRDRLYKLRNLQDYNFWESGQDKGSGVREKSKQIVELLGSNESIRSEREKARQLRNKFVGISNSGGGYGGSSYGGSSYGGSGGYGNDSYSSSSYSGRDSYSGSGSGSGSGGRYNDSYSNDSYSDRNRDSYSDRGRDTYSDRDNNNSSGFGRDGNSGFGRDTSSGFGRSSDSSSRYGGGAYDSSRPPRFSDEVTETRSAFDNKKNNDDDDFQSKKTIKPKIKVNIKKTNEAPPKQAAPEIDLFSGGNDDFMTASAPSTQSAAFDPFAQQSAAFSTPTPAPAPAFDPFAQQSAPFSQPTTFTQQSTAAFPPAQTFSPQQAFSTQQQQYDPFSSSQSAVQNSFQQQSMQQQNVFSGFSQVPAPAPSQAPTMTFTAPPPIPSNPPAEADFGEFQQNNQNNQPQIPNKWKDLGGLVDLGGLSKNEDQKTKMQQQQSAQIAMSSSSFAGLDGFSKSGMPSAAPIRQMGMPMGGQMGVPMGGQMQMGMPMGGQMQMGMPMGGQMGMPMGGQMGMPMGGQMQMGMPMGGQMGMPMGGQMQMGMPMGGQMGMPMGGQPSGMPYGGVTTPAYQQPFNNQQGFPPRGF